MKDETKLETKGKRRRGRDDSESCESEPSPKRPKVQNIKRRLRNRNV